MVKATKAPTGTIKPVVSTLKNPSKIQRFERVARARGHFDGSGSPRISTAIIELAEERLVQIETNGDPAALKSAGSLAQHAT